MTLMFSARTQEQGSLALRGLFADHDPWLAATARLMHGHTQLNLGVPAERAAADFRIALELFSEVGDRWGLSTARFSLADLAGRTRRPGRRHDRTCGTRCATSRSSVRRGRAADCGPGWPSCTGRPATTTLARRAARPRPTRRPSGSARTSPGPASRLRVEASSLRRRRRLGGGAPRWPSGPRSWSAGGASRRSGGPCWPRRSATSSRPSGSCRRRAATWTGRLKLAIESADAPVVGHRGGRLRRPGVAGGPARGGGHPARRRRRGTRRVSTTAALDAIRVRRGRPGDARRGATSPMRTAGGAGDDRGCDPVGPSCCGSHSPARAPAPPAARRPPRSRRAQSSVCSTGPATGPPTSRPAARRPPRSPG